MPLLLLAVVALGCNACGKKPSDVDAPDSVQDDTYPWIYPDPATDPKPQNPQ